MKSPTLEHTILWNTKFPEKQLFENKLHLNNIYITDIPTVIRKFCVYIFSSTCFTSRGQHL